MGPKSSIETNILKKDCFYDDKSFWPISPRFIVSDGPRGTIYKDPEGLFFIVQVISLYLWDLKGC